MFPSTPQKIKLVYASSSSVYGKEASVPFRLDARTDHPGNMYAATKKTDELLGYQYCTEQGMSMVGLRFFTVYGPWGRPDMAVYTFAQAMVEGKDVPLFDVKLVKQNYLSLSFSHSFTLSFSHFLI